MPRIRRNTVQISSAQNRFFAVIGKAEFAREHYAHMLLFVNMLGQIKPRAELDHDQAAHIAADDAGFESLAVPLHLRQVPGEQVSSLTPEQRERVLAQFGLERPLADQYVRYLTGILQGDLGYSTQQGRPVTDMLLERLPWTLVLVGGAITLSLIVGAGAGFLAAARRGGRSEVGGIAFFMFLDSMPPFWIGMLLLVLFSGYLKLLPVFGSLPLTDTTGGFGLTFEVA